MEVEKNSCSFVVTEPLYALMKKILSLQKINWLRIKERSSFPAYFVNQMQNNIIENIFKIFPKEVKKFWYFAITFKEYRCF